jgi:hypothetical protein
MFRCPFNKEFKDDIINMKIEINNDSPVSVFGNDKFSEIAQYLIKQNGRVLRKLIKKNKLKNNY